MGVDSRRPPLPAPTDISSANENNSVLGVSDDLATNISHVSDKTHYTIPEDGTPVTITTKKHRDGKKESSTSLLIEYFEGTQGGGAPVSRPSLRVRVTPSASRKLKKGRDHIQISETTKSGRPSAIRRISLPSGDNESVEISSGSDVSSTRPPVEVEVFHEQTDRSELGTQSNVSRYMAPASDISSMPPESMLDSSASKLYSPKRRRSASALEKEQAKTRDTLKAPARSGSRSASRERIAQRALEKLQKDPGIRVRESSSRRKGSTGSERSSRSRSVSKELLSEDVRTSKSRSSKHRDDSRDRSLHPSDISVISSKSAASGTSINNPRLLNAVEDAIKKLILPELNAVKEEQRAMKNRHKFEEMSSSTSSRREERGEDERRVSKSSSLPSVNSRKPDIIADDRGVIHESSGRRRSSRRSSRESMSDKSYDTTLRDSHSRRRSSGEKKSTKETALASGFAGAALMGLAGAALGHRQSSSSIDKERKKRRSKSRSRSASISEQHSEHIEHDSIAENVPPLPMQSHLESDLTRDSILSADTERPESRSSQGRHTPIKEVRHVLRGSAREIRSPVARNSLKTPISMHDDHTDEISRTREVAESKGTTKSSNGRTGMLAAGLGAAAAAATAANSFHHKRSFDDLTTTSRNMSPVQSEASFRMTDDVAQHPRIKSIRSTHSLSSDRKGRKSVSPVSAKSVPGMNIGKQRPGATSVERAYDILPEDEYSPATPRGDDLDQWLEREHLENDRYRRELDRESLLTADHEVHRDTLYTEDSMADDYTDPIHIAQDVRFIGAKPQYIHTPPAVESAVGSLQNASAISFHSSNKYSPTKQGPISQAESLSLEDTYHPPPNTKPLAGSKQRWEVVRDRAMAMTNRANSPAQSETHSIDEQPILGATYVPAPGDIPEIGIVPDDESELITNPSIVEDKLGGASYQPTPDMGHHESHHLRDAALLGAGATAAAVGLGLARDDTPDIKRAGYQPSVEELEDEEYDPHSFPLDENHQEGYAGSPAHTKDEGYISANHPMSPIPNPIPRDVDTDNYNANYDDGYEEEDPFTTQKHLRHASGLSHGMATPLYNSATGNGLDRIESRDVVALMDHLTVRDAQRNARDTEILVTLVRSAAEMRNNFEDMKRFILEQDKLIMNNMERGQDTTVQRVMSGPRPLPTSSPRTPKRSSSEDGDDLPTKRQNVFRRALKGLSMRSTNDLGKIEDMLNQLLSEVEGLKESQAYPRPSQSQTRTASLNSYEHLRAVPDPGYEPEGRAGTNSSPAQSGHLSNPSSRHLMHSGFDGRRASEGHRISTVHEDDEEAEEPSTTPRNSRYADGPGTPTREGHRGFAMQTPPEQTAAFNSLEPTPKTDKSRGKHKSGSSIFSALPRISRWSKTTTSTIPESTRNSSAKKERPYSQGSRSGSNLELESEYDMNDRNQSRSQESFDDEYQMSGAHNRAGSPLIPEDEYELDDPKYQVHRNSQNLQHPQPRPGPTHRHQNHLETQAMSFEHPLTPDADHWGSAPALAKNRYTVSSGAQQHVSPVHSEDGDSQHSASEEVWHGNRPGRQADDGPLVPPKITFSSSEPSYNMYGVPMMNSGMHIASPLEPIEEVRKSLETDRSSIRHEMTPSPRQTTMQAAMRKIGGPREMPRTVSSSSRRKAAAEDPPDSPVSYETYRTSLDSVTF